MARPANRTGRESTKAVRMSAKPASGVTFINAKLSGDAIGALRLAGSHITAVGVGIRGQPGDCIVDLEGDRLLPGLINAHDHLQLNSLPRPAFDGHYRHVREWISDVDARRRCDPEFEAGVAVARDERLLIGGVKNLLSGVTTVAHHDRLYPFLSSTHYPTSVVHDYGWAHSLYVDGEHKVTESYRKTRGSWPWIIHAAEGVDTDARDEFERLEAIGCLGPNTLLVHGTALDDSQRARLARAGAGLLWCPTSNLHLFGRTAEVRKLAACSRVALGTDSRLSGSGDLLDEVRAAAKLDVLDEGTLESLVTRDSARLLRLSDRGELRAGARADILILPARTPLTSARRADVRLLLRNGIVRYGDSDCARRAQPGAQLVPIRVDGRPKVLDSHVAEALSHARILEAGLEFVQAAGRAA
jgi:cytosine/adenosine deaminase-related metal-dependent hydrolase